MGQYYKAVLIDKNNMIKIIDPHKIGDGSKLTEHSWIGTNMINAVMNSIYNNPCRIWWMGDYSADVIECKDVNKDEGLEYLLYLMAWKYDLCIDKDVNICDPSGCGWLVNHTKNCYLRVPYDDPCKRYPDIPVHPLPILCATSNGQGGGDYHGSNMNKVGSWAGDEIEFTFDYGKLDGAMVGIIFKEDEESD